MQTFICKFDCKNNIMRYSNSTFPYIKERKVYFKI